MIRFANNIKTVMLLGAMMGLFIGVGSMYGTRGMVMGLAFGGLANLFAWFFSHKIAISAMRGQEVGPDAPGVAGRLYEMVDRLRQSAGLPMPRVYICPHEAPNAFATGRSPGNAAVAVTEGALRVLDAEELEGVIGHELAHVKNRDTLTSCIAATIAGILAFLAQWGMFLGGGRGGERGNPLFGLLAVLVGALGAAILKAMISRSREFVADHDGAKIAGSPDGLISALRKLDALSQRVPLHNPNPAYNSLFIVEPLTASSLLQLFASHPPTEQRVAALESMRGDI